MRMRGSTACVDVYERQDRVGKRGLSGRGDRRQSLMIGHEQQHGGDDCSFIELTRSLREATLAKYSVYKRSVANREFVGSYKVRYYSWERLRKQRQVHADQLVRHRHNDRAGACSINEGPLFLPHMLPTTSMSWQRSVLDIWQVDGKVIGDMRW